MNSPTTLLLACGFVALVSIPLIMRIVPPNRIYGFRTRRTLANESTWFRANAFAGWALFIAAIASAVLLMTVHPAFAVHAGFATVMFVGPLLIAVIASFLYLRTIPE